MEANFIDILIEFLEEFVKQLKEHREEEQDVTEESEQDNVLSIHVKDVIKTKDTVGRE